MLPYTKADKTYNAKADKGTVLFPKLFRRLVTYKIYTDAGINKGTFTDYIAKGADRIIKSGKSQKFSTVIKRGKLTLAPEQLVFKEEAATLKDNEGNKVTAWFN